MKIGNPMEERQHMGGDCETFDMCASFVQAHYSPSALD